MSLQNIATQVLIALYYRNLQCTSLKVHIGFQCRGFSAVIFVLNGKISNTAKKIVQLVRTEVHIEGSKIVENVIILPLFHIMILRSMYCECGLP